MDLLAGVISKMANMKNIRFVIGGDGPKRTLLEEVREKHNIQDKVTLLGALEHSKVEIADEYFIFSMKLKKFNFFSCHNRFVKCCAVGIFF